MSLVGRRRLVDVYVLAAIRCVTGVRADLGRRLPRYKRCRNWGRVPPTWSWVGTLCPHMMALGRQQPAVVGDSLVSFLQLPRKCQCD